MASNKDRGYIVDVISENEKKKFECVLCLAIIKKATHGCKKHVFCKDCIHDYIKSIERKEDSVAIQMKCPAGCGHTFNKNELISSDYADQLINQISCRCKDCDWKGELLDFVQVHDEKCIEKEVTCQLCSTVLKRKDMDHHLKDVCSHRPMVCRGCQKNFPFVDHSKHEESCDDIIVECSFKNFGCNVQETRRKMIAHEHNSCQQHLSLVAKYFTHENKQLKEENMQLIKETKQLKEETKQLKEESKQLKEETKQLKEETKQLKEESKQSKEETMQLKEETKQLKEETKQLKEENMQLKEETKQLKEENKQLKEKVELLEANKKMLTWNISQILLKEPANNFFHFPAVDEMHIKNISFWSEDKVFDSFSKNNFTFIIELLAKKCDLLNNYKQELNELFSSTKTIMMNYWGYEYYFFQIDDFKFYKSMMFSIKKDGNIFYIEKYNNRIMEFYISKWYIKINMGMMEIDITKRDERFQVHNLPTLSSKYFCFSDS